MDAHDEFPASAATSLMLAVIATSDTPLLLLAGDLTVVAASLSFCAAFDIDPATVPGKSMLELGDGEWNVPQLGSLLTVTASPASTKTISTGGSVPPHDGCGAGPGRDWQGACGAPGPRKRSGGLVEDARQRGEQVGALLF